MIVAFVNNTITKFEIYQRNPGVKSASFIKSGISALSFFYLPACSVFVGRASKGEATFTVTAEYIQALHKRPRNFATFQIEVTKLSVTELSNVSVFESDFHFFG